jgi:hypothetical protein
MSRDLGSRRHQNLSRRCHKPFDSRRTHADDDHPTSERIAATTATTTLGGHYTACKTVGLQHAVPGLCAIWTIMSPFSSELETESPHRCHPFFAHTADAKPVPEGAELVVVLKCMGWRWSISTTRPRAVRADAGWVPQSRVIRKWVHEHLSAPAKWCYLTRQDHGTPAVDIKREHFYVTAVPPVKNAKARPALRVPALLTSGAVTCSDGFEFRAFRCWQARARRGR